MKKITQCLVFIIAIIASSCDTTTDCFSGDNNAPTLLLKGPFDSEYSIKQTDSMKITQGYYLLDYKISDEEKLSLSIQSDTLFDFEISEDITQVAFASKEIGIGDIQFKVKDSWGRKAQISLALTCFKNIRPVARLNVSAIEGQVREVLIDASASYDADKKYGGKIVLYRFLVNGKEIEKTYHSSINYTYPETGQYEIGVEVMDNDQEWSSIAYKNITL